MPARTSWIDDSTSQPLIDTYARKLDSFTRTFADGHVDAAELQAQEDRVTELMREIEPRLDDALHAKVTQLLCELTAYDLMQAFHAMQGARPSSRWRP